jgi:hypothetical protein
MILFGVIQILRDTQELGGGVDKVSKEQFCLVQSLILMHLHNSKEHARKI